LVEDFFYQTIYDPGEIKSLRVALVFPEADDLDFNYFFNHFDIMFLD